MYESNHDKGLKTNNNKRVVVSNNKDKNDNNDDNHVRLIIERLFRAGRITIILARKPRNRLSCLSFLLSFVASFFTNFFLSFLYFVRSFLCISFFLSLFRSFVLSFFLSFFLSTSGPGREYFVSLIPAQKAGNTEFYYKIRDFVLFDAYLFLFGSLFFCLILNCSLTPFLLVRPPVP